MPIDWMHRAKAFSVRDPSYGELNGNALSDAVLVTLANAAFGGLGSAVLAVSGGADSTALLLMAERWRAANPRSRLPIHVAVVDHGLRPEAATEASEVLAKAHAAGFTGHLLEWREDKPRTGVQAAAREARYALLAGLVQSLELPRPAGIIVAHHLDDQAETFLMRLARGSGIDGLAAMQPERALLRDGSIILRRPLLAVPKAALTATLKARGRSWIEDPSNADPGFERVRLRRGLAALAGLGIEAGAIATSARRLARARAALEAATQDLARRALDPHHGAYAEIDAARFDAAPEEIRLRLLHVVLTCWGSGDDPPRMQKAEDLLARLSDGDPLAATLSGCRIERRAARITAIREPGRKGLPVIELAPGDDLLWDNRFRVARAAGLKGTLVVRALTPAEVRAVRAAEAPAGPLSRLPRAALSTLPAFWQGDRLLAVAPPAFGEAGGIGLECRFSLAFSEA